MLSIVARLSTRRTLLSTASHAYKPSIVGCVTPRYVTRSAATYSPDPSERSENSSASQTDLDVTSEIPAPKEAPIGEGGSEAYPDWSKSYFGLSTHAFPKESADILLAPIDPLDVEMKPGVLYPLLRENLVGLTTYIYIYIVWFADGLIYLPEIKYRRVLNRAFGPGGWGLAPRSETNVGPRVVSREYALVCQGR